jgi:hypothetical protein
MGSGGFRLDIVIQSLESGVKSRFDPRRHYAGRYMLLKPKKDEV